MSEDSENNIAAAVEADAIKNFRQELKGIQEKRRSSDGTIGDIDVDSLGSDEMRAWEQYKKIMNQLTQRDFLLGDSSDANVKEALKDIEELKAEIATLKQADAHYCAWMNNRLYSISIGLQDDGLSSCDMFEMEELYQELLKEKERVFGK